MSRLKSACVPSPETMAAGDRQAGPGTLATITTINGKVIQLQESQLLQKLLHANHNAGFVFNKCRIKSAE